MSKQPWPRLTETLTGPKNPELCQSCCARGEHQIWQEHDDNDKAEAKAIVLCQACSDRIIEPHPRLYDRIPKNAPIPGFMPVCIECIFRTDLRCMHPQHIENGGPGLPLQFPQPVIALVDGVDKKGKRFGRRLITYTAPVQCPCQQTEDAPNANPSEGELRGDVSDVQSAHGVDGNSPGATELPALQPPAG